MVFLMFLVPALIGGALGWMAGRGETSAADRWVVVPSGAWRAGAALFAWNVAVFAGTAVLAFSLLAIALISKIPLLPTVPAVVGTGASMLLWMRFGRGLAGLGVGVREVLPVAFAGSSFYWFLAGAAWIHNRYLITDDTGMAGVGDALLFMVSVPAAATCIFTVALAAKARTR